MADNTASASTLVAPQFVQIAAAGATLTAESFSPAKGAVDNGETVTVNLRLRNLGNVSTTNLVATLQASNGVTPINPLSQTYGVIPPSGFPVGKSFSFSASGSNGGTVENRFRFLKEIVEAIITVWPARRVGVRLSPNGNFNDMGAPEFRETFTYAAKQLNSYGLSYLHVVDGLAFGFHEQGRPMTLSEFRAVFSGYTQETAEVAIASCQADLIAFGRPYLSNPDLVERFANGWELNPPADMKAWSAPDAKGYTDFPFHARA